MKGLIPGPRNRKCRRLIIAATATHITPVGDIVFTSTSMDLQKWGPTDRRHTDLPLGGRVLLQVLIEMVCDGPSSVGLRV